MRLGAVCAALAGVAGVSGVASAAEREPAAGSEFLVAQAWRAEGRQEQRGENRQQRGENRQQRQENRQERQQNRQENRQESRENRAERRENRQENRQQRQENRQQNRQESRENRVERRENRQENRQERQENRQQNRQESRENRIERRENRIERRDGERPRRPLQGERREPAQRGIPERGQSRGEHLRNLRERAEERRPERRLEQRENRIERREDRVDRREDRIERRLDRREDRIDRRLDRREDRVDRRENRIERRQDRREDRLRFRRANEDWRGRRLGNPRVIRDSGGVRIRARRFRDYRGREWEARSRRYRAVDRRYYNRYRNGRSIYWIPPVAAGLAIGAYLVSAARADYDTYYTTFRAGPVVPIERRYSLDEIIADPAIRSKVRSVDLDTITFAFGSAEVSDYQAGKLEDLADAMLDVIEEDPGQVFLVAGHTDAVGDFETNLDLSEDRAAAVVELLVSEYGVPARNLEAVGYGEAYLLVDTQGPARENRRVVIRAVGDLLARR